MKKIDCSFLRIATEKHLHFYDSPAIRGFIASSFQEEMLANRFNNKLRYSTALVQYKVLNGEALIVGIDEGVKLIAPIKKHLNVLELNGRKIFIRKSALTTGKQLLGCTPEFICYKFLTPWLPLNQNNYPRYCKISQSERLEMLKKILIGNIISFCKSFGYTVPDRIIVRDLSVNEDFSLMKGQSMVSFIGTFRTNFLLPQYWGIGRSPSRGYGTIAQI